jgi:hypothetical protein
MIGLDINVTVGLLSTLLGQRFTILLSWPIMGDRKDSPLLAALGEGRARFASTKPPPVTNGSIVLDNLIIEKEGDVAPIF